MESNGSIFIRRHTLMSVVCTILIVYPNLMWMPWNVATLGPDEIAAFWTSMVFRCSFFVCLFYLLIGFNLRHISNTGFLVRFRKNLIFTGAAGVIFITLSQAVPLLTIQSSPVGKYLMFQFIIVPLICTFIGYIAQMYDVQSKKAGEIERLKLENLQSRYNALANQVNPHFFFNSLNGISSLVRRGDEEVTLEYIDRLSDIFRYILRNETDKLVALSEEIQFVEAFIYVMEVRFRGKLMFDIQIGKEAMQAKLPVLSLLPLLENISTHNRIDSDHKMVVRIATEGNRLVVSNPIYPKSAKAQTNGSGLDNLCKRFELLTGHGIEIVETKDLFTVKLPL